jgi:hypothetical protein
VPLAAGLQSPKGLSTLLCTAQRPARPRVGVACRTSVCRHAVAACLHCRCLPSSLPVAADCLVNTHPALPSILQSASPQSPMAVPYMSIRRYGEAWAALARAKQLHGPGLQYEPEDYAGLLASLSAAFPPPGQGGGGSARQQQQRDAAAAAGGAAVQRPLGAAVAMSGSHAWQALRGKVGLSSRQDVQQQPAPTQKLPQWLREEPVVAAEGLAGGGASSSPSTASPPPGGLQQTQLQVFGPRPILVAGLPRSGSSLLEQILSR